MLNTTTTAADRADAILRLQRGLLAAELSPDTASARKHAERIGRIIDQSARDPWTAIRAISALASTFPQP